MFTIAAEMSSMLFEAKFCKEEENARPTFFKQEKRVFSDAKSVTHRVCNVDSVSPSLLILQGLWPTSGWKDVARETSVHVLSQQCPLSHACYIYTQGKTSPMLYVSLFFMVDGGHKQITRLAHPFSVPLAGAEHI